MSNPPLPQSPPPIQYQWRNFYASGMEPGHFIPFQEAPLVSRVTILRRRGENYPDADGRYSPRRCLTSEQIEQMRQRASRMPRDSRGRFMSPRRY
jgi:hypothetical protein